MNRRTSRIGYYLAVIVFLVITIGPFVWAVILSVTPESEMFAENLKFLPNTVIFTNYQELLTSGSSKNEMLMTGMINSLEAVLITMAIGLPMSLVSAYVLTRMEFRGRRLIMDLLIITMVIPVMATIIPIYRIFSQNGLLNNMFWLSIIYVTSLLPMVTWLESNYFATIPREIEEAAMMDGCSRLQVFCRIIMPMSYPIIICAALIIFLNTWNMFQIPLILASSVDTKPIAIIASEFASKDAIEYGMTAAFGIIAIVPPAIAAIVFRKFLISGMVQGAVKG